MGGDAVLQEAAGGDGARVVHAGSLVELGDTAAADLGEELLEAVARGGAHGAVLDHALDRVLGAGVDVVAGVVAVVRLHHAGVGDAVVGGGGADAAVGLLHGNGEDEAGVDAGGLGDVLNGGLEVGTLRRRVVGLAEAGARLGDDVLEVGLPHGVEAGPLILRGPARGGVAIAEESLDVALAAANVDAARAGAGARAGARLGSRRLAGRRLRRRGLSSRGLGSNSLGTAVGGSLLEDTAGRRGSRGSSFGGGSRGRRGLGSRLLGSLGRGLSSLGSRLRLGVGAWRGGSLRGGSGSGSRSGSFLRGLLRSRSIAVNGSNGAVTAGADALGALGHLHEDGSAVNVAETKLVIALADQEAGLAVTDIQTVGRGVGSNAGDEAEKSHGSSRLHLDRDGCIEELGKGKRECVIRTAGICKKDCSFWCLGSRKDRSCGRNVSTYHVVCETREASSRSKREATCASEEQ